MFVPVILSKEMHSSVTYVLAWLFLSVWIWSYMQCGWVLNKFYCAALAEAIMTGMVRCFLRPAVSQFCFMMPAASVENSTAVVLMNFTSNLNATLEVEICVHVFEMQNVHGYSPVRVSQRYRMIRTYWHQPCTYQQIRLLVWVGAGQLCYLGHMILYLLSLSPIFK